MRSTQEIITKILELNDNDARLSLSWILGHVDVCERELRFVRELLPEPVSHKCKTLQEVLDD